MIQPWRSLLAYRDISPWQVHLIPDGPVAKVGVKTHPWDFQEGLHHNFKDQTGNQIRELHALRLVVNHTLEFIRRIPASNSMATFSTAIASQAEVNPFRNCRRNGRWKSTSWNWLRKH